MRSVPAAHRCASTRPQSTALKLKEALYGFRLLQARGLSRGIVIRSIKQLSRV